MKRSVAVIAIALAVTSVAHAQQVSPPVTLQWFESSWKNIQRRTPDLFQAGYGALWTPPPGRSIYLPQGGGIGYDPYDRFDMGSPRDPTLYGTQGQYLAAVNETHKFGGNVYVDYVHHHVGSLDLGINGYTYPSSLSSQGAPYLNDRSDYPGFELSDPNSPVGSAGARDTYAALYGANAGQTPFGDVYEYWFRLGENLVTIDLAHNRAFVRNPVPGNAQDIRQAPSAWAIPTTTLLPNGQVGEDTKLRQANVPLASNAQFYPDLNTPGRTIVDNGVTYTVHDFNLASPLSGDAVPETTAGYMMRYAQWLVQVAGVDGLRIDAARHVPLGVQNSSYNPDSLNIPNLIDRAVAGADLRTNLDGTKRNTFNFQEVFDYDANFLKGFVRKSQPAGDTVNPNRDVLDFSMWSAMATNMTGNGTQNNWFNIRSASVNAAIYNTLDPNIANNGDNGIGFVYNHDEGVTPPGSGGSIVLDNVAHAWILMRPGNAYVYYRSDEFDRSNNSLFFLKGARGDALGGQYGSIITTLVDARNSYGRGNFLERYIDNAFSAPADQKSAIYVFERQGSCVVGLNVGYNEGATQRTITTSFAAGTHLEEATGNWQDPSGQVPRTLTVGAGGSATISIPWNNAGNGNKGYVIYGLPLPRGTMSVRDAAGNPITQVLDETPTAATNGTARIADIDVVTTPTFRVRMNTSAVTLSDGFRDHNADGDRALLKVDDGFDANNNGSLDNPSSAAANATKYGFESFTSTNLPGSPSISGDGTYEQIVNASGLNEGYHYVTVRAWRKQGVNESEVYKDFRRTIYVDRFAPVATLDSTAQLLYQNDDRTRDLRIRSTDKTATNVNVLFDVPASLSDSQVLALVSAGNKADQIDVDLFGKSQSNVGSGNHTIVSVTSEVTGRYTINRYVGQAISTSRGLGLGDVNYDQGYSPSDVNAFETVLYSNAGANPQFVASGDLVPNGIIDTNDLFALRSRYASVLANQAFGEATAAITRRGDVNQNGVTNAADIDFVFSKYGTADWYANLVPDSTVDVNDINRLIHEIFNTDYGDSNLDGTTNFNDLLSLAQNYGFTGGWAKGDFTGDGLVNFNDLLILAQHYGQIGYTGATFDYASASLLAQAPEPGVVVSMFLSVGTLLRRRRATR